MNIHDNGYKTLLRNRTIFRQLIQTFVDEPWVNDLDFSQAETIETTFIDEEYRQTQSDLIYRLRLHDQDVYFYILMEFQSTVDRWMALRIANYVTNFYMSLVKERKETKAGNAGDKLPAVFPLMLYNGDSKWTSATALTDLVEDVPDLGPYGIQCRYLKIAENEFSKEELLKIRNIVSTLFLAEAHYDIDLIISELGEIFEREDDRQAVSLLLNWFQQMAVHGRIEKADFGKVEEVYRSTEETRVMLATAVLREREEIVAKAIAEEKDEILQQGIEQGREEGCDAMQATLEAMLLHRFGTIPDKLRDDLELCTLEHLKNLVNPLLNAPDLDSTAELITRSAAESAEFVGGDEADS